MAIPAEKIGIEIELERRRPNAAALQSKLDIEEIGRRIKAVEEGRSRLIPADEVWSSLENLGY